MKQIQGSVRVKIKENVHAWSEFLFVSLLLIFNFFPQINHFYFFTSRHGLQDVENHCAHLRDIELKTGRKIPYLRFPHVLFSIWLDLRVWNYKTKKNIFASNPEKRTQKDMNEMEWHKMDYLIFSALRMRKLHLFCTSSHHKVTYEELNKGSEPCPC